LHQASQLDKSHALIETLTTHETFFFRDVQPFELLRHQLLPRLLAARASVRRLVIWTAACSTGQEPYSVAMLVREHFPDQADWIEIVATDLSSTVLDLARAGRYRQADVNRGLSARQLLEHFDQNGLEWVVKAELRRRVVFARLNLAEPLQLGFQPDIVLLRNVLIYFDLDTKRRVLQEVRRCVAADGALLLGAAETAINIADCWEHVPIGTTAYYRPRG